MLIGMLVVVYLFVGGSGAGALFVTCAWSLAFHRREDRTFVVTEAFEGLKRKGLFVGVALVVVSSVFLLLDLGRPELFFLLFARPTPTPISFGSFFLAADILLGAFLLVASLPFGAAVPTLAKKAAEVLCLAVSFAVMAYTGVFVAGVESVALWHTFLMPPLFVLSSLSAGIAVLLVVASLAEGGPFLVSGAPFLHRAHLATIVLELLTIVLFVVEALSDEAAAGSLALLLGPSLGPWFVVGVGTFGIALPFVSEVVMARTGGSGASLPLGVSCLIGCFLLRFCIVAAGMH